MSFVALASLLALAPAPTTSPQMTAATTARDRALAGDSVAFDVVTSLTTEVGGRPVGSPAMTKAREWALSTLTKLGFQKVHAEAFTKKNAWLRGPESATLTAPYTQPLSILGLGNSPATPEGGVEADVVVFPSFELLTLAPAGSLKGKIAVVNQPMTRTQTGEGYGAAVKARGAGPGVAEEKGAVAFLTRSIATGEGRAPHTGATGGGGPLAHIPSAALGIADADLLSRLAARGTVRLRLSMTPTIVAEAPAWNIAGELPGKDPKAGTIVLGAHLDSWDPGQGALDDGAGVAIVVAAAKLLADLPKALRPDRTIRVVLFGSEETGGSSDAYIAAHKDEVATIALTAEADSGAGRIYRLALPKDVPTDPHLAGLATALAPLKVFLAREPAEHAGSDVEGLQEAGVPIAEFDADASRYFDVHHSADDTLDKVDRDDLAQVTATWATVLAFLADADVDLRHPPAPPSPPR